MKKSRKRIGVEIKKEIIGQLLEARCEVSELAKLYGVTGRTLQKWRREEKKKRGGISRVGGIGSKFIELSVEEKKEIYVLKKAEFLFSDMSLSVEGNVGVSRVIELLKREVVLDIRTGKQEKKG